MIAKQLCAGYSVPQCICVCSTQPTEVAVSRAQHTFSVSEFVPEELDPPGVIQCQRYVLLFSSKRHLCRAEENTKDSANYGVPLERWCAEWEFRRHVRRCNHVPRHALWNQHRCRHCWHAACSSIARAPRGPDPPSPWR